MKERIKRWLFSLAGKDPEGVVVTFLSGDPALAKAMEEEVRRLEPSRRHFSIAPDDSYREIRKRLRPHRIGLAAVLYAARGTGDDVRHRALRRAALRLAPTKLLAYNGRLERHHLSLASPIASWLFLRGVPLDRIFLKPWWLCPSFLKRPNDRTVRPPGHRMIEGRPPQPGRRRIAVLTPYFPYPLSHGGAVRMFNLLREVAREFDIDLYAFTEGEIGDADLRPVLDFAARVYLVKKPRYREPRWSTLAPPELEEYRSPEMKKLLRRRETNLFQRDLLQVEYTYLAPYGGDILVEHDVTFDLYAQVRARRPGIGAWWDWWRWRRFERRAIANFRSVVVMSEKDRGLLNVPQTLVIENGVDLGRFEPQPEHPGRNVLFIGSFRHFPNIVAYRFLTEEILPLLSGAMPDVRVTVVAGPDPWLHWRNYTGALPPAANPRIRIHEFVADVRPLYHEANVVVVPTLESAGTNVKVLEAMAMERVVVSTVSGCAGFGLRHGETIWIADTAADLAAGIRRLLDDDALRSRIARAARAYIERRFDWRAVGLRQREMLRELLADPIRVRPARNTDLPAIAAIQSAAPHASHWDPKEYLEYDCRVATCVDAGAEAGTEKCIVGFVATRQTAPREHEILNIAVDPAYSRRGIGRRLIETVLAIGRGVWFLEVRESNVSAVKLYTTLGFTPSGRREMYYHDPAEAAIVMKIVS